MVEQLAVQHRDRIKVLPLAESVCIHMAQTTEERLAAAVKALVRRDQNGEPSDFEVRIADEWRDPAREALECMFEVCR